jgi:cytochrome c oxidase subunit 1
MTATIDLQTTHAAEPSGGGFLRRLNFGTGIIFGVIGALLGYFLPHHFFDNQGSAFADQCTVISAVGWVVGFWFGIGALAGPFKWFLGWDQTHADDMYLAGKNQGKKRYWKYCTDHKVVGVQYLVLAMVLLGAGGILAMLIRTDLISPGTHFVNQQVYNSFLSLHGMLMIISLIIAVAGPWGNFVMPIQCGARDMAFPRLNALSLWTVVAAAVPLLTTLFIGGIQDGWTTYAPISIQTGIGMNTFAIAIITFVISTTVAGVNTVCTIMTMRTTGMSLDRLPIFTWASLIGGALGLYAMPFFATAMTMTILDRSAGTSFFSADSGGTGWLWENMFWLMGHPEVYVILIPAVGALLEIATVFSRKPLFSYKTAIGGMAGIAGLSILVWAHHMFTTGWAPQLGGPFMLTTELISIPTGIIFLVAVGTIWRGNLWMKTPMIWLMGFIANFIIGGVTGIYLSDIPVDNTMHGTMFVVAHFHYVFVGSVLFGAIGAVYFWFPKISGRFLDEKLGRISFWLAFIGVQVTFLAMFVSGLRGMPRRYASYQPIFEHTNVISTIGAYIIMAGMLVSLANIILSWRSGEPSGPNPWQSKTLEWLVPTPVPLENFEVLPVIESDPYTYGEKEGAHA